MKTQSTASTAQHSNLHKVHCSKIEDILSRPARRNIFSMIPTFFVNNAITVTETLHRGDMLQLLDNTDMMLQRAIQMSAIEVTGKRPIQETITEISRLVMQGMNKVISDKKNHVFPHPSAAEFLGTADTLYGQPEGLYLLNGAIAGFLQDTRNWNEKIVRLSSILDTCPKTDDPAHPGAEMLIKAIDEILAEIILMPANLPELIGDLPYLGDVIDFKARLFLGQEVHGAYGAGQGLDQLARHMSTGLLPLTHITLGQRLLVSIALQNPLYGGNNDAELKAFYRMVQLVRKCAGPHLPMNSLKVVMEQRSGRFSKPEALRRALETTLLPDEKIAKLFFIAACIIDARGRYAIADMIFRFATAESFMQRFQTTQIPLTRRLHRLSELNHYALKSSFDKDQCQRMARIFDDVAFTLVQQAHLFEIIDAQKTDAGQKLLTLYKLFAAGDVTEGKFSKMVREKALTCLSKPSFMAEYAKARKITNDANALWTDLREKLERIGIEPNTAVKKIAV